MILGNFSVSLRTDSSREFANGVAAILVETASDPQRRAIAKAMSHGSDFEKIFYMRAGWKIEDPKIDKALSKLTRDKKPEVRRESIAAIARRGNLELLDDLERVLDKDKDPRGVATAITAITELGAPGDWPATLAALTRHEGEDLRNVAVSELGASQHVQNLPVLIEALDHDLWSTRLKAARAIEALRAPEGIGALCARMAKEDGRVKSEIADILWRMTGQDFRGNASGWGKWWAAEGHGFQVLSEEQLAALEDQEELHRLKEISRTTFFGIRVLSHRVIFIIDSSGSMDDPTRGQFVGEMGEKRMDVAKKEIEQCLDSLEVESLFNIITFANSPIAWQDRVSEWTKVSL